MSNSLKFKSLEELIGTMKRGNEIQFRYREKMYGIFPTWSNCSLDSRFGTPIGCIIGESFCDRYNTVSFDDLPDYKIDGNRFADAFDDFEIIERAF